MDEQYRIRLRRGDTEIEVSSHDRSFVEKKVKEYTTGQFQLSVDAPAKKKTRELVPSAPKSLSTQEFIGKTKVHTGPEYVLAVTYFKEIYEDAEFVRTGDIASAFKAIGYKCANISNVISRAKKKRWLMDKNKKGSFVTTQTGEKWIKNKLEANEE